MKFLATIYYFIDRPMENLDCSRIFYKNYERMAKYSQCRRATYSFYRTRKCRFHASVAAFLQVRPGLRYATANNEDEDVYVSGFWGGKQTSEAFFMSKLRLLHLHIVVATQVAILTVVY